MPKSVTVRTIDNGFLLTYIPDGGDPSDLMQPVEQAVEFCANADQVGDRIVTLMKENEDA